ncbi:MAG: hypothetical protein CVV34_03940 [Methanomicrobiales archaeon HGW-Methanomicrobiales-5]|nr:MAG: hypothetical protein CVV34_03940 [Methanomicrobiales archaeon HGW-Methanomicrobiales-5]
MTSTESKKSPLTMLVLFMVCLSIAGTVVAGAHYYAVDLPAQEKEMPPENDILPIIITESMDRNLPEIFIFT